MTGLPSAYWGKPWLLWRRISRLDHAPNPRKPAPIHPKAKAARHSVRPVVANLQTFRQKMMARVLLILNGKNSDLCTDAQML
jgi:hypothetical protein